MLQDSPELLTIEGHVCFYGAENKANKRDQIQNLFSQFNKFKDQNMFENYNCLLLIQKAQQSALTNMMAIFLNWKEMTKNIF